MNPNKEDSNKIEVKLDENSKEAFEELKKRELSLGENCLLEGKSVLDVIDKSFKRDSSVPDTSMKKTQLSPLQRGTSVRG
ncbi:MAG: hypothetical protein LBV62_01860 [Rickettsiales bacterium]|jgi:hypothetical protein|nr:hypothetical protein [Rickettsiales bacterium]